jgi:hypothetical protein
MAPPKKFKKGTRAYTFRADAETWDEFAKIAQDRNEILADIFQAAVDNYIKQYGNTDPATGNGKE